MSENNNTELNKAIKQDIFSSLNEQQLKASTSESGNILVLAGAGTGKTSTIVARVVHLLTNQNVEPKNIVLLTFTNKASVEMKERLKRYICDDIINEISVSTFHALCLGIIRKYYPKKKLITQKESLNLLETTYSRVIKFVPEGLYTPSTLASYIDNYINNYTSELFSEWLDKVIDIKDNKEFLLEQYQLVYSSYTEDKDKYNVLSFSDLLVYAKKHIESNENTIEEMIVDEFQDTNPLQNSTLLSIDSNSLFCVGDYDQSIYGFNGADLNIIKDFNQRENFKLYNLSKNYRCRKPILDIAEKVIANNLRIYPKSLEVMIDSESAVEPYCFTKENALEQYLKVAELCQVLLNNKKQEETIAILYRSNSSGNGIEMAMRENSIEIERNVKNTFMENIDIQIIFNILKLIVFKKVEYLEFAILFTGVVSSTSKEAIESYYNMITYNGNLPVIDGLRKDNARSIGVNGVFFSDSKESVLSLLEVLEFNKFTDTSTLIATLIHSDYFNNTINRWASSVSKGDDDRANDLYNSCLSRAESILEIAKRYSNTQKFVMDMVRPNLSEDSNDPNKVRLMTVHSSKGLEFDYVFIIDLDDETFPNKKLMSKDADDCEERRLFYVGCTRSKQELVFSYAKRNKRGSAQKPSRFLIEGGLVKAAEHQSV